jgi:hypothetical protein
MPEMSSGPWQESFFTFPHARKSLPVPGRRPFTFPQAGKVFNIFPCRKSMPVPGRRTFTFPCRKSLLDPGMQETFSTFPHARKSLPVPGRGPFTFPHAGKVFRSLLHLPMHAGKVFRPLEGRTFTFPHAGKVFGTLAGDLLCIPP